MKKFIKTAAAISLLLFAGEAASAQTNQWRPLGGSPRDNISGMALLERAGGKIAFVVVHDNKKAGQDRAAIVSVDGRAAPKYEPLRWLGEELPVDLEAISTVPGAPNDFMALASAGKVFHIELNRADRSVKIIKSFDVPQIPASADFEGFALQKINNIPVAIWAERGSDAKPARLLSVARTFE